MVSKSTASLTDSPLLFGSYTQVTTKQEHVIPISLYFFFSFFLFSFSFYKFSQSLLIMLHLQLKWLLPLINCFLNTNQHIKTLYIIFCLPLFLSILNSKQLVVRDFQDLSLRTETKSIIRYKQ